MDCNIDAYKFLNPYSNQLEYIIAKIDVPNNTGYSGMDDYRHLSMLSASTTSSDPLSSVAASVSFDTRTTVDNNSSINYSNSNMIESMPTVTVNNSGITSNVGNGSSIDMNNCVIDPEINSYQQNQNLSGSNGVWQGGKSIKNVANLANVMVCLNCYVRIDKFIICHYLIDFIFNNSLLIFFHYLQKKVFLFL